MAENTSISARTRFVVIGGGYAGTMAANRLTQREDVDVTLFNPRWQFVERIRLHQLVGGTHDAVHEFRDVLAKGVALVVDTVVRIDAARRTLQLASGGMLEYDYLVYAAGSTGAEPSVPGAAEFALSLSTYDGARRARAAIDATAPDAHVTVVGAGPTGIETAAELAEQGRAVTLVTGGVLGPYLHPAARRALAARLAELGVRVLDGPGTRAAEVGAAVVRLADRREIRSDVTLWTAGFAVPDLAVRSGLSTDPAGRLRTDETLTSVDDPRIVAAGDAAAPSGVPYRMSCQAAIPLGQLAADAVLARADGRTPRTVSPGFVGQCLSIGRRSGMFQIATGDDHATRAFVGGRTGAVLKEGICWSTYAGLVFEGKHPGMVDWAFMRDGGRARRLAAPATAGVVAS